jgi:steroid delta-isomerase-like uncharacterized protein
MTRQEVESLFKRRIEAQNSHDIPAMVSLYTDDCVLESPTAGTPVRGAAGIESVHRAWMTGFPDVVFTSKELLIDGDRVAQVMEAAGTDTGGFMGLAPTGKAFRTPIVIVCTLKGGKIQHERRIYDFTGLLIQIGVLKAKPG